MRVRELLPFIDENQEIVIRASEGSKTLGGTALVIKHNQDMKEVKEFLDRNIVSVYNHCWKMYIIVEVYKEMKFECELMKSLLD